jgi:hypothetical protein
MISRAKLTRLRERVDRIDPYSYDGHIEADLRDCQGAILDLKNILIDLIDEQIDEIDAKVVEEDGY